ncbi:MAG: Holliday junction resolvase RuvX [Clostridia bacterium]|nr:Holliday junction resolvase RuvX [Clostridia bacterium]
MARVLGIDLGDVRTGVALSDPFGQMASGLMTITEYSEERLITRLADLIREKGAQEVVMGLPINMDGSKGPRAQKVSDFALKLEEACGMKIILVDERCSTMVAHRFLNETNCRGKKRKQVVDTLSAEIILQDYLDKRNRTVKINE